MKARTGTFPVGAMRRSGRAAVAALAAVLALAASPAWAQYIPREMPEPARGLEIRNTQGQQIDLSLSFFDEDGRAVTLAPYFNRPVGGGASAADAKDAKKPVVVVMMYFSCPLQCPLIIDHLAKRFNDLDFEVGNEFDVLFVSFDPRDKPRDAAVKKEAALLSYNRQTSDSIREGWHFLTSPPASARALADELGFPFRFLPESGEFAHPNMVYILTPEGKVARSFGKLDYPNRDFRFALMEASNGKIGDTFDKFTFWCYHFDPSSGSYTLQAMRVMQIGASATAVVLGGLLLVMLRHERRKARRALATAAPAAEIPASPAMDARAIAPDTDAPVTLKGAQTT